MNTIVMVPVASAVNLTLACTLTKGRETLLLSGTPLTAAVLDTLAVRGVCYVPVRMPA